MLLRSSGLGGTLPRQFTQASMPRLTKADLAGNSFSGTLPAGNSFWQKLPQLEDFDISHNNLAGSVPASDSVKVNNASSIHVCVYVVMRQ